MRILQISDVYFPRVDGVSTSIRSFMRELEAKGHGVTLIAPDYRVRADEPAEDVIRVSARRMPFDPADRMMKPTRVLELTERLRGGEYDLVHVHTPFVAHYVGRALARRLGLPLVETYPSFFEERLHHYIPFLPGDWVRFLARDFSRAQCNGVDRVIVPSSAMAEVLKGYGVRTPIRVVPTGIEPHVYQGGDGARFRAWNGIAPDQPALVYVGRLAPEKNVDFLLHVLRAVREQMPSVVLVLAGRGPAEPELRDLAGRLGIAANVRFVGSPERPAERRDCYRAGDCFVFASRTETQGLPLLEAMACGVPVIALPAMGTTDVLKARRGALCPRDEVADFAAQAVALLRDPERRQRLGEEGRAFAQEWSASAMAERVLDTYAEVCAARAPVPRAALP